MFGPESMPVLSIPWR